MLLVTRIDPFGRVGDIKIGPTLEARTLLQHRNALLFRSSWIHRRFVYDYVASLKSIPNDT
jgi:hypothetical protein